MRCALPAASWLALLLSAALQARPAAAQGPGWVLGEPDDCQRKEIAAEPHKHRFWTDAAPVTLYQYAYLQPSAAGPADPADGPPRRRIQLQKRHVDALDLWSMDQATPAFDFSYSLVGLADNRSVDERRASWSRGCSPSSRREAVCDRADASRFVRCKPAQAGGFALHCRRLRGAISMGMSCRCVAVRLPSLIATSRRRPTRQSSRLTRQRPGRSC